MNRWEREFDSRKPRHEKKLSPELAAALLLVQGPPGFVRYCYDCKNGFPSVHIRQCEVCLVELCQNCREDHLCQQ